MPGFETITANTKLEADVIIIGSGAGGASVADVLTRAGLDVIMLEEGPSVPAEEAPETTAKAFTLAWRHAGLTAALGRPPIAYGEGRCVGGSTEINAAIFQRAPDELVDDWGRRLKIDAFSPADLAPFYDRAAKTVNASLTPGPPGRPTDILIDAGKAMHWKTSLLERGQRNCVGTNACPTVCPTGGKQSMSRTLLPQALSRGLRLFPGMRVEKIRVNGSVATGVDVSHGGARNFIRAHTIFVCAGAIQTPALLRRSGLGGSIGRTLQMHPTFKAIAEFDEPVNAHLYRHPLAAITEFMPNQRIGGSVFSPGTFALSLAEDWAKRREYLQKWKNFGIYYGMIRPKGQGAVRVLPGFRDPLVSFKLTPEDWAGLSQISGRLGEAMFAAGAKRVIPSITGHTGWTSMDALKAELPLALPPGRTNLMTVHLFGSCPLSRGENAGDVDGFGRVSGLDNLLVADASVIPEAPGVNPQGTVMALAFRAAEHWLAGAGRAAKTA